MPIVIGAIYLFIKIYLYMVKHTEQSLTNTDKTYRKITVLQFCAVDVAIKKHTALVILPTAVPVSSFFIERGILSMNPLLCVKPINSFTHFLYSDSVWHCFVFDPLRVVRAKLFRIVHSSVTRSFIRGAWRGSCDTICPALSFHFDFTDVSDLCYGLPTFGHFTIYLCHASLAQKRCKLFYVYLMLL